MLTSSHQACGVSFCRAVWLWTDLSRYGGFRRQEFAMKKKEVIQVYVIPNGTCVVRAFAIKNFLFYDIDGIIIDYEEVLLDRSLANQAGQQYDIQKN